MEVNLSGAGNKAVSHALAPENSFVSAVSRAGRIVFRSGFLVVVAEVQAHNFSDPAAAGNSAKLCTCRFTSHCVKLTAGVKSVCTAARCFEEHEMHLERFLTIVKIPQLRQANDNFLESLHESSALRCVE